MTTVGLLLSGEAFLWSSCSSPSRNTYGQKVIKSGCRLSREAVLNQPSNLLSFSRRSIYSSDFLLSAWAFERNLSPKNLLAKSSLTLLFVWLCGRSMIFLPSNDVSRHYEHCSGPTVVARGARGVRGKGSSGAPQGRRVSESGLVW